MEKIETRNSYDLEVWGYGLLSGRGAGGGHQSQARARSCAPLRRASAPLHACQAQPASALPASHPAPCPHHGDRPSTPFSPCSSTPCRSAPPPPSLWPSSPSSSACPRWRCWRRWAAGTSTAWARAEGRPGAAVGAALARGRRPARTARLPKPCTTIPVAALELFALLAELYPTCPPDQRLSRRCPPLSTCSPSAAFDRINS